MITVIAQSESANLTLSTTLGLVLFPLIGLVAAWGCLVASRISKGARERGKVNVAK
jgi:hypothetical protein